jgi:uncharacterized protein (DUF58 family)
VVLRDAETGEVALVHGERLAAEHAARWRRERSDLHRTLRRLGVDHLVLRTDRPYLGPIVEFFETRRRRLSR